MIEVIVIEHGGETHHVSAESGTSLMELIVSNQIPGIDADCGGACACGTCHCFIDNAWRAAAGEPDFMEEGMLGTRPDRAPGSRLACQIQIEPELAGLVVRLPEFQM